MTSSSTIGLKDFVHTLHEVLNRENSLSRCQAVRALEHLNARDEKTRARLIALLLDPDPDVRIDAANALGELGIEDATESLIANLKSDPEGDVRIQAVIALSKIESKQATDALVHCFTNAGYPQLDHLSDDMEYSASFEIHSQALDALGKTGDPTVVGPVIELLEDETYEDLHESGFAVLARLDSDHARAFLLDQLRNGEKQGRRRAVETLAKIVRNHDTGRGNVRGILETITEALLDRDPDVRISVAKVLGDNNHLPAVIPLTLLLSDPIADVRKEIVSVLVKMRGPAIVDRLLGLLKDASHDLKTHIVRALGEIGDSKPRILLTAMLDSTDEILLGEIIRSLAKIGEPGPEIKIAEILENVANPPAIRVLAAQSLQSILKAQERRRPSNERSENAATPSDHDVTRDDKSAASDIERVLENALFDKDDAVRLAAMSALVEISPQKAAGRLTGVLRGELTFSPRAPNPKASGSEPARINASAKPEEQDISPAVAELLVGADAETSTLASIMAKSVFKEPAIAKELAQDAEELAQDQEDPPDRSAKILAARLLGQIHDPGPKAVETLEEISREPDIALQREAYLSLGRVADPASVPVVLEGLEADEPLVRLSALEALGGFHPLPQAGERVAKLLDDPDSHIRKRAVESLASSVGSQVAGYLPRALRDEDREVCRAALRVIPDGKISAELTERITELMFEFSGELRRDAAVALRRAGDTTGATKILAMLKDDDHEDSHWICIDALAELYAERETVGAEV